MFFTFQAYANLRAVIFHKSTYDNLYSYMLPFCFSGLAQENNVTSLNPTHTALIGTVVFSTGETDVNEHNTKPTATAVWDEATVQFVEEKAKCFSKNLILFLFSKIALELF